MNKWRVWPDGTVQDMDEGEEPYSWMSDDFAVVSAHSENEAVAKALGKVAIA